MRRRLADDRRCSAFFHPALIDEPLIFVKVALTTRLSNQIGPLIDSHPDDGPDAKPTTAIFYSISNCQEGLSGISFGNLLIKQVVDAISTELPSIRHFATLSPIPGFRAWLDRTLRNDPPNFMKEAEFKQLAEPGWAEDPIRRAKLKPLPTKLCALYLTSTNAKSRALDPVARFHLGNGASIERINWEGEVVPEMLPSLSSGDRIMPAVGGSLKTSVAGVRKFAKEIAVGTGGLLRTGEMERLAATIRPIAEIERDAIENAIKLCDGKVRVASILLGISHATLYRKINSWKSGDTTDD